MHYVGLDVHKKSIAYCVKQADGVIVREGTVAARREDLGSWAAALPQPWTGAMEATLFSDWVYDHLDSFASHSIWFMGRKQAGCPPHSQASMAVK
jgi:hypothetical protein